MSSKPWEGVLAEASGTQRRKSPLGVGKPRTHIPEPRLSSIPETGCLWGSPDPSVYL